MSREAVIQMLSQADADPTLRHELDAVMRAEREDKVEAFLAAAGKHGFDFTQEEFHDVLAETPGPGGEIGDAGLQGVTGGASGVPGSSTISASGVPGAPTVSASGVPGAPTIGASGVPGLPTSPTVWSWAKSVGTTLGLS